MCVYNLAWKVISSPDVGLIGCKEIEENRLFCRLSVMRDFCQFSRFYPSHKVNGRFIQHPKLIVTFVGGLFSVQRKWLKLTVGYPARKVNRQFWWPVYSACTANLSFTSVYLASEVIRKNLRRLIQCAQLISNVDIGISTVQSHSSVLTSFYLACKISRNCSRFIQRSLQIISFD